MKRNSHRIAALAAAGALALAGCAGGSGDAGAPSTQQEGGGSEQEDGASGAGEDASGSPGSSGSDSSRKTSSAKDPAGTHVARTAGLTIEVEDVERAGAKVRSAASRAGGYVSSEEMRTAGGEDDDGSSGATSGASSSSGSDAGPRPRSGAWAEITVTVPVDELDSTLSTLAEVGEVTQRTSDAEDLTKQYTDTAARVRTMEKSIERLRDLIDETDDLDQVVTLEDELSEREADLESMVSQKKSLEKRTTTAPITVSLVSPEAAEASEETEETGFLAGLEQGWSGFTSALAVGLTVLGAVTPFVLTALVVLAPVAWWLRRRARRVVPEA